MANRPVRFCSNCDHYKMHGPGLTWCNYLRTWVEPESTQATICTRYIPKEVPPCQSEQA